MPSSVYVPLQLHSRTAWQTAHCAFCAVSEAQHVITNSPVGRHFCNSWALFLDLYGCARGVCQGFLNRYANGRGRANSKFRSGKCTIGGRATVMVRSAGGVIATVLLTADEPG